MNGRVLDTEILQQSKEEPMPDNEIENSPLAYQFRVMQTELAQLKTEFGNYVREREYNLQTQAIKDSLGRLEVGMNEVKNQYQVEARLAQQRDTEIDNKIQALDKKAQEAQDRLQIRVLTYIVVTGIAGFMTIGTGLLLAFITHLL